MLTNTQVDDDLSSVVWKQMDDADPRSPIPAFLCPGGKKKKEEEDKKFKPVGDSDDGAAAVQEEQGGDDGAATKAPFKDYGLLWRMWRVTKPLASRGLGCPFFWR